MQLSPWYIFSPLVDPETGTPTAEFLRWMQLVNEKILFLEFQGVRIDKSGGSAQSIPNATLTAVEFNTVVLENQESEQWVNLTSNDKRIVIPKGKGITRVCLYGSIKFEANNVGDRGAAISKNGTLVVYSAIQSVGTGGVDDEIICVTGPVSVADEDFFELLAFQRSSGSIDVLATAQTAFSLVNY